MGENVKPKRHKKINSLFRKLEDQQAEDVILLVI